MGLQTGFIKLNVFVFILTFALLLQDYQVECRGRGGGGGRGGGRSVSRGSRYVGGGGGSTSSGGGGSASWWIYLVVFGGSFIIFLGILICVYLCTKHVDSCKSAE